jgi:HEAT repeat protein
MSRSRKDRRSPSSTSSGSEPKPPAKLRSVDAKLTRLRAIRTEPLGPALVAELRGLIADKSNFVVAEAAEIVGESMLADLAPDLAAAFPRFMVDPVETDKICRAKIAITDALHKVEYDAEDLFRTALRHVQMEPVWGGSEDTAAPLRAAAAFALLRLNPRDLVLLLAELLADPEKVARSAAAKALGASGALAAIPLLRFKARVGDEEPEVIGECLTALVTADPAGSVAFVGEFLDSPTESIAEGAALALAESRRPDAFERLKAHWPKVRPGSLQNVLLLAIAITRLPAALEFLLEVLAGDNRAVAEAALAALAIHRHNPAARERIAAVIAKKGDAALRERFGREFRMGK